MKSQKAGKDEEACVFFRASVELDPKPAARFKWATCLERTGKLVAALAQLQPLQEIARGEPGPKGQTIQREIEEHLRTVESRLAKLVLKLPSDLEAVVALDGVPVTETELSAPISLDPGAHQVKVVVGDTRSETRSIDLAEGETKTLDLSSALAPPAPKRPEPTAASAPAASTVPSARAAPKVTTAPRALTTESTPSWPRIAGVGLTGLGAVSVGSALGLAVHTQILIGRSNELAPGCEKRPDGRGAEDLTECNQSNLLLEQARSAQTGAFISLGVGAALAAAGVMVLVLTPSKPNASAPKVEAMLRPQGAELRVHW